MLATFLPFGFAWVIFIKSNYFSKVIMILQVNSTESKCGVKRNISDVLVYPKRVRTNAFSAN